MMRWKKFVLAAALIWLGSKAALAQEALVVYSSLKESAMGEIRSAFMRKYPDVDVDLQVAGAAKLMAKVSAERDSEAGTADVLWTSEMGDFLRLKADKALVAYVPVEARSLANPLSDYDGSFTVARMAMLGLVVNTRFVKETPKTWQDVAKPSFKDAYGVANPTLSGTAYLGVAQLARVLGWPYFEALHANGAHVGKSWVQLVDETAAGDLLACLAMDYVAFDKIDKGAPLAVIFPAELVVIPSPIAILKRGHNLDAAKKFVDFVLSVEGQTLLANEGLLPVRSDVAVPERYNLPKVADAVKRAAKIDYAHLLAERDATVRRFAEIMQK